jgi:Tol biopolymer transport system component
MVLARRIALTAALALVLSPAAVDAAFPGANGKIAFERSFTGVATIEPDGSGQTFVTPAGQRQEGPAWSPDGTKLALAQAVGGYFGVPAIYTVNADGSNPVRITSANGQESHPAWSPDGRKLVFERVVDDSTCDEFVECGQDIFTIDVNGSNERRLTDNDTFDLNPVWSPDGTKIAFSRYERGSCVNYECDYDIFTMNADGTGQVNLTHNDEANFAPDWSPDGKQIVFSSTKDSCCVGELFRMNADGSGVEQLTFYSSTRAWSYSLEPGWSPDGEKIAFAASNYSIGILDLVTGDVVRVADDGAYKELPDWQPLPRPPDCSALAASRPVLTNPNHRLVAMTLDGASDPDGDPVTITIDGVTQDEPVEGRGDSTSPDAIDDGDGQIRVRAERDPRGDGRVYRIAFTGADGRGESCSGQATVAVPRKKHKAAVDSAPPSYDSLAR